MFPPAARISKLEQYEEVDFRQLLLHLGFSSEESYQARAQRKNPGNLDYKLVGLGRDPGS